MSNKYLFWKGNRYRYTVSCLLSTKWQRRILPHRQRASHPLQVHSFQYQDKYIPFSTKTNMFLLVPRQIWITSGCTKHVDRTLVLRSMRGMGQNTPEWDPILDILPLVAQSTDSDLHTNGNHGKRMVWNEEKVLVPPVQGIIWISPCTRLSTASFLWSQTGQLESGSKNSRFRSSTTFGQNRK